MRAAWIGALALAAVAITALLGAFALRRGAGPVAVDVAAVVVCGEAVIALLALSALARHVTRQTAAFEGQRHELTRREEQARAEARQKARLAGLLDAALANAPIGVAFFDHDLRVLRVNRLIAETRGLPAHEHVGLTLPELDPTLAAVVEPHLRHVFATGEPVVNVEIERPAGPARDEPTTWLSCFYPIATADGELFAVGVAAMDVSEFKRLETQLRQAQKMEAVGRLAGGVAHDFNNLLTVISSYAELILYDPHLAAARGEIEEIRGAAARAAKLTRQLLAFSRRQALEPQIVNPNDVLRGMDALMRRLIVGNITVRTVLSPDTPLIRVDPGQLEQVVMNLAINAADAMPDGGLLTIETAHVVLDASAARHASEVAAGEYAMLRVRDTGSGMDAEMLAQIFEPFFTTKEAGKGTGLGLSTVYGIVRQSGGHIDVTSQRGAGSVFTVYLPAVGEQRAAAARSST